MLVDRLSYHLAVNAIQNGGIEPFFAERFYSEDNELFRFITTTPEYKEAQQVVRHWLRKQEQESKP
jgi:hypothetical protein